MSDWAVFWLRIALILYSVGLWHSLVTVVERRRQTFVAALTMVSLGLVFHVVSLVMDGIAVGGFPARTIYQTASLTAFLITTLFLWIYWRYRQESISVFVFPLVFMIMSSLKPDLQLLQDTSSLRAFLPVGDISLNNYAAAFDRAPVATFVMNSVIVTGITVLLSLLLCSLAAFSFVFLDKVRDKFFTYFFYLTQLFTQHVDDAANNSMVF